MQAQDKPSTLKCSASLWKRRRQATLGDVESGYSLHAGGDPDKDKTAYYTGDTLIVSEAGISGLFRNRRADLPNSNLPDINFDAREVVIDGPLYSTRRVQLYADTVRFTARGSITLVSPPPKGQTDAWKS